ncbi:MAG TPA: hypothetical protein VFF06_11440 [Polyangia bacterium]|nr:hypothetical protein [Polyangia bacterium]
MLIDAARGALTYFVSHPTVLLQAARNAARFELSVPIDLLRWAIDRRPRGKGPEKIELFDADPAIGVALTVDLYGTKLTVSARIEIESIENLDGELKVSLRVSELHVAAPPDSPAAMMINSMDLSRPGNLMKMMPQKHAALVSAEDDRFVLDLMKIPALAKNARFRRVLGALSFIRVGHVRAGGDLLAIGLDVSPTQIPAALGRAAAAASAE